MTNLRRLVLLLLAVSTGASGFGQYFTGGKVEDLPGEAMTAARALEDENLANLLKLVKTATEDKANAVAQVNDMFGPPATSPMTLSVPIGALDAAKVAQDADTQLKLAATFPADSTIRKRMEDCVQMRQRDLAFRLQLEALAANGRPALGTIDRLKLANGMRSLTNDQLNSILMRWVEMAAHEAAAAEGKNGALIAREQKAAWVRAWGEFDNRPPQ